MTENGLDSVIIEEEIITYNYICSFCRWSDSYPMHTLKKSNKTM